MLAKGSGDFYYASGYTSGKITATYLIGYSSPVEFCVNDAYELILEEHTNENGFRIKTNEGYLQYNTGTSINSNVLNDSYEYTWSVSIDNESVSVCIRPIRKEENSQEYTSYIAFGGTGNNRYFYFSTNNNYPTTLYRKVIAKATSSGYATFCSSKDVAISGGGMKAYVGTVMGNELVLTEVDKVKANEGVILFSETPNAQAEVTVTTLTDDEKALFSSNALKAASVAVTVDNDGVYYALTNDANGDAVFCPVEPGVVIPAGKAYLHLGATSPAKISINMSLTPTTLSTERHTETPKDAYNLSGQKVGSGYHGIVITNGRKVIK